MYQPKQLELFLPVQPTIKAVYDPYWDELEAQADDIVEEAFLSTDAKSEIFDIEAEIAPQQNTCVGEQISFNEAPYKCVGEQVLSDTLEAAPQHDAKLYERLTEENPTHWVEKYWVERVGNKYWYYRYMWMEGRRIHRVYIGAVASKKAIKKKQLVEDAILGGDSSQEIKQLIRQSKINSSQGVFC